MASSENQGLQIALIIFVMLTILLSVTTFMFFREYTEAFEKSKKDAENATKAQTALTGAVAEMDSLKKIIGVNEAAKIDEVQAMLTEDMLKYAPTAPDESKFYRPALEHVAQAYNAKTAELIAAREEIQQERDAREKVEKAKQTQVAAAEANAKQAQEDLAKAKAAFEADRKKMTDDQAELARQLQEKNTAFTELADKSKKQIDELTTETKKLDLSNEYLRKKNEDLDPTAGFEVPDGEIVWVDQRSRSAYINVGQADGLRRQTTFSVVAGDENVGSDQKTKGRLEVTEVLGPHFAECRILEDKLTDPLVTRDKIYTPLWHPGRSESFALVGFIDLDGDGKDDRETVRELIRMNGGRIDAEDSPEGKQIGELNLNTRYLVLGEQPHDDALSKAYTKLQGEALKLGVRFLPVSKFLDQMGWKNPKQTLLYGRRGNALDVPAGQPDGGRKQATGNVSSAYKVRRPLGKRGLGGMRSQGPAPQPATTEKERPSSREKEDEEE